MTLADIRLSELEHDALAEVVNIGVSRAAASLRKMVGQQVLLSVPALDIVSRKQAVSLLGERESDELIAVRQSFERLLGPRSSYFSRDQQPVAGQCRDRRRAFPRGAGGDGGGGARRDRQHHSQQLPRHHGQHAATAAQHVHPRVIRGEEANFSPTVTPAPMGPFCSCTSIFRSAIATSAVILQC